MSDEPTTGQEPDTTPTREPQAPETQTASPEAQTPEDEPFDRERALATIRKLRAFEKQANDLQKRVGEFERREQEAEMARLSREEQLAKQLQQREAELEFERQQYRDRQNQYELQLEASKQGVVDPEAAAKLLNWGDLEYDDDGRPTNLADALSDLLERKSYLKGQHPAAPRQAPGNPTNPVTRQTPANSRIYTTAEIADPAIWKEHKADIMRALREDRIRDE